MIRRIGSFLGLALGLAASLFLAFNLTNLLGYFFLRGAPLWFGTALALGLGIACLSLYLWVRVKARRNEAPSPLGLFLVAIFAVGLPSRHMFVRYYEAGIAEIKAQGIPTTFRELAPLNPEGRWGAEAYRILVERHKKLLEWDSEESKNVTNLCQKPRLSSEEWAMASKSLRAMAPLTSDLKLMLGEQNQYQFFKAETEEKFSYADSGDIPTWGRFLSLTRLLCLEARSKARLGDKSGAQGSLNQAALLARISADDPTLIGKMISIAQIRIVCGTLALTTLELPGIIRVLAARRLVSEGIRTEVTQSCELVRFMNEKSLTGAWRQFSTIEEKLGLIDRLQEKFSFYLGRTAELAYSQFGMLQLDFGQFLRTRLALVEAPKLFTADGINAWEKGSELYFLPIPFSVGRILYAIGMPRFGQMYVKEAESDLSVSIIPLVEAARNYKNRKGAYPNSLDQLKPLLPTETKLDDPFLDTPGPLRIKEEKGQFIIYSVGQNGVDDGGSVEDRKDIGYKI